MRNLHQAYYKDYFSLQDVSINDVNRHLDYELLLDDTKKNRLEEQIRALERQKRNAQGRVKDQIEAQISKIKVQLAVNVSIIKVRNDQLTGSNYSKKDQFGKLTKELKDEALIVNEESPNDPENRFSLDIAYPGLVTGVGINHEAKIEGEFKLGVHFDWTYGMPVVYGSSVKGVLRSAFISKQKNGKIIEYEDYYLKEVTKREWSQEEIKILFDAIFEGKDEKGNNLSIYDRDIFFDAVITHTDSKGRILCSDSITPHGDNPLKNPIPITFLKIAPRCKLEFRFKLVDTKIGDNVFNKEDKLKLFKKILTTVGIGAKTNVGYGQLKSVENKG